MSEAQEKYNTENTKQTFIDFAYKNLVDIQSHVSEYNKTFVNDSVFINCLSLEYSCGALLLACFTYLINSPNYDLIPEKCIEILNKKAYDYSSKSNRYSNFEISNQWAENCLNAINNDALNTGLDNKTSFAVLLGTKVAILTELLESGKTPNNESIEDSILDFMNYRLLLEGFILGLQ